MQACMHSEDGCSWWLTRPQGHGPTFVRRLPVAKLADILHGHHRIATELPQSSDHTFRVSILVIV